MIVKGLVCVLFAMPRVWVSFGAVCLSTVGCGAVIVKALVCESFAMRQSRSEV